jgi:hypothetical protein
MKLVYVSSRGSVGMFMRLPRLDRFSRSASLLESGEQPVNNDVSAFFHVAAKLVYACVMGVFVHSR